MLLFFIYFIGCMKEAQLQLEPKSRTFFSRQWKLSLARQEGIDLKWKKNDTFVLILTMQNSITKQKVLKFPLFAINI